MTSKPVHNNLRKQDKKHLLNISPKPLFDNRTNIAVLWSHKSACTFISKWFYFQLGHGVAAEDFHNVHFYRDEVYYKSKIYRQSKSDFANNVRRFSTIKIVRNPYSRAVSSYFQLIHMLKSKNQAALDFVNDKSLKGISFEDFVLKLEESNIAKCNLHWRQQLHPLEQTKSIKVNQIIKLKEANKKIKLIEEKLELRKTNLNRLKKSTHHSKTNSQTDAFVGDKKFTADEFLNRPSFELFYNDVLKEKIYKIYKLDFEFYDYSKKLSLAK